MEPIFETSMLGFKVRVFEDRLEYGALMQQQTIPISQIASIDLGLPIFGQIILETTGGRRIKIPVKFGAKKKLQEAIYQAQAKK